MPLLRSEAIAPGRERSARRLRARSARSVALRYFATLVALATLFVATLAQAAPWTPPPLRGHVVDEAAALTDAQTLQLDRKLDRARNETGFAIVVYLLPRLPEGRTIEDVGYEAGNAWGVGSKSGDDGVLLLASLGERKLRIETGKGVGGALTDVQSSRINREVIGPLMKQGRTYEAMNRGVDAVLQELVENTAGGTSEAGRDPRASRTGQAAQPTTPADFIRLGVVLLGLVGVIVLAIISPTFRHILFWLLLFGRGGGSGGGRGGGGSGYGGGGGRFGGGGSSDDY